jgi:hypothetical protein
MSEPTNLFWYSSVAVQLLFCAHLIWSRLAKRHPIFTAYLGYSVLRSLIAMQFTVAANGALPRSYTYFWLWSEPILLLLQIAVTLEVHGAMWKEHTAVANNARPLLYFSLITAIVFAAVPMKVELSHFSPIRLQAIMQFEFLAKRYVSTVLAVFLVLSALMYLVIIRNSLKSNLVRHESLLAVYFGIYAVAAFAINMGWGTIPLVNHYTLSAVTLCLVVWISVFKPNQELPLAAK